MIFDNATVNPGQLSPITLAFVGDAVYSLIVREELAILSDKPADRLHKLSAGKVSAAAQCRAMESIMDALSEEELAVFKRGRNAATKHTPKNASGRDYHYATGFEALFGYLYLSRRYARIQELYALIAQKESHE
ncbi:MAG: ribonuclease III [Clostridia bacterium]|nr:ribonuclease III [Clostridia bacterium]